MLTEKLAKKQKIEELKKEISVLEDDVFHFKLKAAHATKVCTEKARELNEKRAELIKALVGVK